MAGLAGGSNVEAEFHPRKPGAEPMTTKGHALGVKVGNDRAPEFRAETHAPGTAPPDKTHKPVPDADPSAIQPGSVGALDMPGATSQQVHNATEFGKPMQGQTSREVHGAHVGRNKKERTGLEGVGASRGENVMDNVRATGGDLEGRAAELQGTKGNSGRTEGSVNWPGAEA